jgi:hypothetical protein
VNLTLGLCLLIVPISAWATAVVVIWTPNGAIFGADAKIVTGDGKDAGTGCKIEQVSNNILFAESGILGVPAAHIDTRSIIHEVLSSAGDLDQRIGRVESNIVPILTGILNAPRIRPGVLKDMRAGREIQGLQVVIVTYAGDHGRAILRNFMPTLDGPSKIGIQIKRTNCPEDSVCKDTPIFTLGKHEAMDDEIRRTPDISKIPPVEFVENLLGIAARTNPISVGPPFAVAFITSTQISWPKPGDCEKH